MKNIPLLKYVVIFYILLNFTLVFGDTTGIFYKSMMTTAERKLLNKIYFELQKNPHTRILARAGYDPDENLDKQEAALLRIFYYYGDLISVSGIIHLGKYDKVVDQKVEKLRPIEQNVMSLLMNDVEDADFIEAGDELTQIRDRLHSLRKQIDDVFAHIKIQLDTAPSIAMEDVQRENDFSH